MKQVAKISLYFLAVVLLGAALAPLLFWAIHGLEPWALANGLLNWQPDENGRMLFQGPFAFLEADFQKIFHRAVLIAALLLLWPAWRWMDGGPLRGLGLEPDPRAGAHFTRGLLVGGGLVALMAGAYLFLRFYHLKERHPWGVLPQLALTAIVVAALEEWVFRGAIFSLFARVMKPWPALAWTTALFAIVHFIRPQEGPDAAHITWRSGFELLPQVFRGFGDPMLLLGGFTTLFTLGWLLGYARLRTCALWMSIGLHAGVVFVKMSFSKFAKRDDLHLPWVGPDLQTGLVPVLALLIGLFLVWRRLRYEELLPLPKRRS